jgi:hypothetical protein
MLLIYILATSLTILVYKVVKAVGGVPKGSIGLSSSKACVLGGAGRTDGVICP